MNTIFRSHESHTIGVKMIPHSAFHYFWSMKSITLISIVTLSVVACKPSSPKDTTLETPTSVTHSTGLNIDTSQATNLDTTNIQPETSPNVSPPLTPAKPKVCSPNFTKLASPTRSQHIYYVTGFNAEEFKCWNLLEEEGVKICGGNSCVVYFVDQPNVKATKTPPHYLDDATLKKSGIARFEFNGKYWEIKGAGQWKRTGKGYGYYNTDNQLGG